MIIELQPFDILTSPAERIYSLLPFWSNLASMGATSARLLVVTDRINFENALHGFNKVAVPFDELPEDMKRYRLYYEQYLRKTVRETQYIRLFLVIESVLDEVTLGKLIANYGISCKPLDEDGVPLPFVSAQPAWDKAVDERGRHWAVIQSNLDQPGAVFAQVLHRIFSLEFPTYIAIDIWNYSRSEATRMLRTKAAVASVQAESTKTGRETKIESNENQLAIDAFRKEIGTVGIGLHEIRISVAAYGHNQSELMSRLELIRGSSPIEFEGRPAQIQVLKQMFSAEPPREREGTLATSNHVAVLSGSALSYARPTNTVGVSVGFDRSQAPVVINLFNHVNNAYNALVAGQTGAGKTFFILLLMIRSLLTGVRLIIIDPKGDIDVSWLGKDNNGNELCNKIAVGVGDSRLNILDPIFPEMGNQLEFALGGLRMLGVYREDESVKRTILDMALNRLYQEFEWTAEGAVIPEGKSIPVMKDLQNAVETVGSKYGREIERESIEMSFLLEPYITGSRSNLFGQQTNVDMSLSAPVNVFDVSSFPSKQTGGAMRTMLFSTLFGLINQGILNKRRAGDTVPIMFFVDEIGVLMRDAVVADYVSDKYKTARSLNVSMIVADQTIDSLLGAMDEQGQRYGHDIFANSPHRFIFFQEGSEKESLKKNFPMMPETYREQIHNLPKGQCVAQTPQGIFNIIVTPSDFEAQVFSSKLEEKEQAKELIKEMKGELEYVQ